MQVEGQIVDIIYKNEINSYTVATFETVEGEELTIVGYLPFVNEGDNLKVTGNMVTHPDYGEQLKVEIFEKTMPKTKEALEKYLANGNFKGIGPATAKKIVNTFGEDTINVIKMEPQKLTQIKGISKEKALEIAEQFIANWEIWQIVGFLDQFGIGPQSAETVYKKLGENALEKIGENPYILIDVASKVNFEKVDSIALKLGIDPDNYTRIRSAIKYGLERIGLNGHSTVLYENLLKFVQDLLRIDANNIEETIISMKAKEEIIIEEREDGTEWVYAKPFYEAEKNIAERLISLKNSENIKYISTLKKDLEKIEKDINIELSDKQREAIESVNDNNVCIITGGPGTGKTTIIKAIIELYKKHGMKPVLCAPTGRAAKRMTETTGEEAKTLHRLLELAGISDDNEKTNIVELPVNILNSYIQIEIEMPPNKVINNVEVYARYSESEYATPRINRNNSGSFISKIYDTTYEANFVPLKLIGSIQNIKYVNLFMRGYKSNKDSEVWTDWYECQIDANTLEIINNPHIFPNYRYFQFRIEINNKDSIVNLKEIVLKVVN